jgi:hypothetical protein
MENEISTAEAARIIGLSANQIRLHLESGKLKGRRVNPRTWLVDKASAEAFEPPPKGRPPKPGRLPMPPQPEGIVTALEELAQGSGEKVADLTARLLTDAIEAERRRRKKK